MAPKRQRPRQPRSASPPVASSSTNRLPTPPPHSELYLRAQEASLITNHDAVAAQVEWRVGLGEGEEGTGGAAKSRMINWKGDGAPAAGVWIDRYDALNLLEAVPPPSADPPSPTLSAGFSDLPSDSEEMFYFDADTREDIGRQKKRRKMDEGREERLRALKDKEEAERVADEPDATQLAMMQKLHLTLLASPSPSVLEIRILANHGADPRFSFLRKGGKWREIWEDIRAPKKPAPVAIVEASTSLVAAYGSDSDDDDDSADEAAPVPELAAVEPSPAPIDEGDEEARRKREEKAEKAREWAAKRKSARELATGGAES
ncbi:hypothetical protein RQP46_006217 [Phenoliferia psychrophenolica]